LGDLGIGDWRYNGDCWRLVEISRDTVEIGWRDWRYSGIIGDALEIHWRYTRETED
jgi:hypothetical protein